MDVLGKNEVKDKMKKTRKHKSSKERQILQASTKLYEIKLVKIHYPPPKKKNPNNCLCLDNCRKPPKKCSFNSNFSCLINIYQINQNKFTSIVADT